MVGNFRHRLVRSICYIHQFIISYGCFRAHINKSDIYKKDIKQHQHFVCPHLFHKHNGVESGLPGDRCDFQSDQRVFASQVRWFNGIQYVESWQIQDQKPVTRCHNRAKFFQVMLNVHQRIGSTLAVPEATATEGSLLGSLLLFSERPNLQTDNSSGRYTKEFVATALTSFAFWYGPWQIHSMSLNSTRIKSKKLGSSIGTRHAEASFAFLRCWTMTIWSPKKHSISMPCLIQSSSATWDCSEYLNVYVALLKL